MKAAYPFYWDDPQCDGNVAESTIERFPHYLVSSFYSIVKGTRGPCGRPCDERTRGGGASRRAAERPRARERLPLAAALPAGGRGRARAGVVAGRPGVWVDSHQAPGCTPRGSTSVSKGARLSQYKTDLPMRPYSSSLCPRMEPPSSRAVLDETLVARQDTAREPRTPADGAPRDFREDSWQPPPSLLTVNSAPMLRERGSAQSVLRALRPPVASERTCGSVPFCSRGKSLETLTSRHGLEPLIHAMCGALVC